MRDEVILIIAAVVFCAIPCGVLVTAGLVAWMESLTIRTEPTTRTDLTHRTEPTPPNRTEGA
jgi:hypothetical protein